MKVSTLCFLLREGHVLLAQRTGTSGNGHWSGYGGKTGRGESIRRTLVREIREESQLRVNESDLTLVAVIVTYLHREPQFKIHVFVAYRWRGRARATDEMSEPRWFRYNRLPYRRMWRGDREWLPHILAGWRFAAHVYMDSRGELIGPVKYRKVRYPRKERAR